MALFISTGKEGEKNEGTPKKKKKKKKNWREIGENMEKLKKKEGKEGKSIFCSCTSVCKRVSVWVCNVLNGINDATMKRAHLGADYERNGPFLKRRDPSQVEESAAGGFQFNPHLLLLLLLFLLPLPLFFCFFFFLVLLDSQLSIHLSRHPAVRPFHPFFLHLWIY